MSGAELPAGALTSPDLAPTPAEQRTPDQTAALELSARLADELLDADVLLFAVPMYNFGVSQHFKAWVDQVIAEIEQTRLTERGATRGDDRVSDTAMEDRKKVGYF